MKALFQFAGSTRLLIPPMLALEPQQGHMHSGFFLTEFIDKDA